MQLRPYQNDLVNRVHDAWAHGKRAPCIVLPCGGGKSCVVADIARRTTACGNQVLFVVHRQELVEQIVRTFVAWGVDMDYCIVGMVQTITRRLKKIPPPVLIITDENHHCLANSYRRIYDAFPNAYKVGVTATPVRLNGDGLGDVNDELIIGVSAKWLIENHCLSPYDYYAPTLLDLDGVRIQRGEYVTAEVEAKAMSNVIFGNMIEHYKRLANGKKAICYCVTVKHSMAVANAFNEEGIPAAHIDGETPKAERKDIIRRFRDGEIRILCNVDLISEGFDVPDCECAILLRATKSLTLFIQQSMRCMRYSEGKRAVIIDHVGNYARFGMPDDDRAWTLEKRDRKKREQNEFPPPATCPECFHVFERFGAEHDSHGRILCPICGAQIKQGTERHEGDTVEASLQKIEGFTLDFRTAADCKSYAELREFGKRRGYKNGWAYFRAKQMGYI